MACVRRGMGATIKPMSAALSGEAVSPDWRCLPFSDASMTRSNYLYSVLPERLSPAAAAVRSELRETVRSLVQTGRWPGVKLLSQVPPERLAKVA
jgi:LysR family tcuABC transcriptional regulator